MTGLDDIKKWLTGSPRDHNWKLQVAPQDSQEKFLFLFVFLLVVVVVLWVRREAKLQDAN